MSDYRFSGQSHVDAISLLGIQYLPLISMTLINYLYVVLNPPRPQLNIIDAFSSVLLIRI